ncbi:glycosyltransferase family 2 protein [Fictibacillus nanhaiensis]|uniref:glycosyltransferase family 2 protein n=1 Tax=Fictibacillus nanhaiensis TaxID=742169 RepID=UPI001C961CBC|nr:glycosyltransferase family 2 protein [Fictibacillus nanhaiensis]MBY6035264.1 glycosyltransferase family 2 protein [Fictibacillus nanhaiensis]
MIKSTKVIVFLPAFNEEESIGEVIQKIPRNFHSAVDVEVMVIDDGCTDQTREIALKAGADHYVSHSENRGLGAAVRTGLQSCYVNGADIAVMIDADNEYPADEIPELIQPLLGDKADYAMGSRFLGTISGMKLHRRLGNYVFTLLQCVLLRRWIRDGQSGMRAFNREAMRDAEIIHDYNYAQVLTLNLVRKGFRMIEVPITYKVRTTGTSFITFKKYLGNVLPGILKEMRRPVKKQSSHPTYEINE